MRPLRFTVLALAALIVLSLGFALIPAEKPAPAEPSVTERARLTAFSAALDMRAAGMELASAGAADAAALDPVVTLLTIQARALMSPGSELAAGPMAGSTQASPRAGAAATPSAGPENTAELVQALAASGTARLKDAETADGGVARLLAGAGTAQLIAAGRLAAAAGVPGPQEAAGSEPDGPVTAPGSPCPRSSAPAASTPATQDGTSAGTEPGSTPPDTRRALAAAVSAEQQAVYGYQAALPRLAPAEAGPASDLLAAHKDLAAAGEARLRLACGVPVPEQPGYVLAPGFLAAPAKALGALEAATLAPYGDLVAISQGENRKWAVAALQSAAGRALTWGADPGPVPGITLDTGKLPELPAVDVPPGSSVLPGGTQSVTPPAS